MIYNLQFKNIILYKIINPNDCLLYKDDIIQLIKLAYYSSFPKDLINKEFIINKFESLFKYLENNKCYLLVAKTQNKTEYNIKNNGKYKIIGLCHYFIKDNFEGRRGHLNQIVVISNFQGNKFVVNDSQLYEGGGLC